MGRMGEGVMRRHGEWERFSLPTSLPVYFSFILKNGKVLGLNLLLRNQYTLRPHRLIFYRWKPYYSIHPGEDGGSAQAVEL